MKNLKILLVYPETPSTFWGFRHALKFVLRKSAEPPLGLITVAGMLPEDWEKKLVDMNVRKLRDRDLEWADLVFVGAMEAQRESARRLISRCKIQGIRVVAGGPLVSTQVLTSTAMQLITKQSQAKFHAQILLTLC